MIIFAAGNKYKINRNQDIKLIEGVYFVFGCKWIKAKKEFKSVAQVYNIGSHYEVV